MQCPKCGWNAQETDMFCEKCGFGLKGQINRNINNTVKIASSGMCPHCGKPFIPKGSLWKRLIGILLVVCGIFFGAYALLILSSLLLGGETNIFVYLLLFIHGALFVGLFVANKQARKNIHSIPCPHCGKSHDGNTVSKAPTDNTATAEFIQGKPIMFSTENKECACCHALNIKSNKRCSVCGFKFGRTVTVSDGKNKFGLTTCIGCSSVYKVKKNIFFIALMLVLGVVSLSIWISPLFFINPIIAVTAFSLAIVHASGKLNIFSVKKCTVCKKTPLRIYFERIVIARCKKISEKRNKKREAKLLLHRETPLTAISSALNAFASKSKFKNQIFTYMPILGILMLFVAIFANGDLTLYWDGDVFKEQEMLYFDALINFSLLSFILFALSFILNIATLISSLSQKSCWNKVPLTLSSLSAITSTALFASHIYFNDFNCYVTIWGELQALSATYTTDIVNVLVVVSTLLTLTSTTAAYLIEKERKYLQLKHSTEENKS